MYLDLPSLDTRLLLKHASTYAGGNNCSPGLIWGQVPPQAHSLALIVHDPDAPTGGMGFTHWLVPYIPISLSGLPEGANTRMPEGIIELLNDYQEVGYGGPCPPEGREHRYIFTLYALCTSLEQASSRLQSVSRAQVGFEINANCINSCTKQLYYKR